MQSTQGDHSLEPDIVMGWKMRSTMGKLNQFPIYFTNTKVDHVSKTLTTFGVHQPFRIIYMGPRFSSNLKSFKAYSKQLCDAQQLNSQIYRWPFESYDFKYFQQKQKSFPIRPLEYRLFTGMNPTIRKDDIKFDSNFQSGNLDLAIMISPEQYDLLMRVDSNTRGHTTWFFFKVSNFQSRAVTFNIINFQKSGLLYKQGMRPYCLRSSKGVWMQQQFPIHFGQKKWRYASQNSQPVSMQCLSFTFDFKAEDQYVYFAYSIPYSYSYMLQRVRQLQNDNPHYVHADYSQVSTGGLIIPTLTITNSSQAPKPYCLVTARLHPGETQGSWTVDGFLSLLCSPKGHFLRQNYIFVVIPMVNVDGVVLGNFRTGIGGRDLNRVFDSPSRYTEVALIRQIASKYTPNIFLDFHGHSGKKNSFTYGPNYSIDHKYYILSRIFPKLVSKLSQAFRYYSCSFRISKTKINTGRAFMLRQHQVTYTYTIQTSNFAYGSKLNECKFNIQQYKKLGQKIMEGLESFVKVLVTLPKRAAIKAAQNQSQIGAKREKSKEKINKNKTISKYESNLFSIDDIQQILAQQGNFLQELLIDQKTMQKDLTKKTDSGDQDSDFQQNNDYSDKQLNKLLQTQKKKQSVASLLKKKKKLNKSNSPKQKLNKQGESSGKIHIDKSLQLNSNKRQSKSTNMNHEIKKIKPIRPKKIQPNDFDQLQIPDSSQMQQELPQKITLPKQQDQFKFNRVLYKNWLKSQSHSGHKLEKLGKKKHSLLNQINLDLDPYQKQSESVQYENEKKRQLVQRQRQHKKANRNKNKGDHSLPKISGSINIQIKQSLLPFSDKKIDKSVNHSSLLSILDRQNLSMKKRGINSNLRIIYF